MDYFIERGLELYNSEEKSWSRGDILGIISSQQAQRDLETELFSQETVQKKSSRFEKIARNAGNYILGGIAVIGLALTGSAKDMISSLDDKVVYNSDNNTQFVPYSGIVQENPVTDGQKIILEENGKITTFDTTDFTFTQGQTQIEGLKHLRIDNGISSFKKSDDQGFKLLSYDAEGFLNVIESSPVGNEPTWYIVPHYSDGNYILRAGVNSGVVREDIELGEEQVIYSNGLVSKLRIEEDFNLFVAEENINGSIHERLLLVDSKDILNTKIIYDGPVNFVEFSNELIYVGIENQQNYQTTDIHVFDLEGTQVENSIVDLIPNSFDVDDGILINIENNGTIYAVNVSTGNKAVVTNSNTAKSNIDIEGGIATWVEDGTRVGYTNKLDYKLFEDSVEDSEFELKPQRVFINSDPRGILTDGNNILVRNYTNDIKVLNLGDYQVTNFKLANNPDSLNQIYIGDGLVVFGIDHEDNTTSLHYKNITSGYSERIFESQTELLGNTDMTIDSYEDRIIFDSLTGIHVFNISNGETKSLENIAQDIHRPEISGDNIAFLSEDTLYITNDDFSIFDELPEVHRFKLEGNQIVYTKRGEPSELRLYDINNKTDRLLINDFNYSTADIYITPYFHFSNGNISWAEMDYIEETTKHYIYNIAEDNELLLSEISGISYVPSFEGKIITWIGDSNTQDKKAYFADINGLTFNIATDLSNQSDNSNNSELEQLLDQISILENETIAQQGYSNQANQTLADIRQEWENENVTKSSESNEESNDELNYGLLIGTTAAALTVGGFLLQNRQIRELKRRAIDPISELIGFDTDSKSLIVPKDSVGLDSQGNVVVHVHGDQYNTLMQAGREADVNAYIGNADDK